MAEMGQGSEWIPDFRRSQIRYEEVHQTTRSRKIRAKRLQQLVSNLKRIQSCQECNRSKSLQIDLIIQV